jgi:hypothetical protein
MTPPAETSGSIEQNEFNKIMEHFRLLRLAINPNAFGDGGDLKEILKDRNLVTKLADAADSLSTELAKTSVMLRETLKINLAKGA